MPGQAALESGEAMDLSKLPKLSDTKAAEQPPGVAAPAETPADPRHIDYAVAAPPKGMIFAEVWIGLIIGIVLMLYTRPFGSYLISMVTRQPFHTGVNWTDGPNAGQEVPYTQLEGGTFYSDSSIFLFGLALALGAMAQALQMTRLPGRRGAAWFSMVCVLLATLYNVVAVVILLQVNIMPLMSLLCVGIGGYIVYYEWNTMQAYGRAPE
ncbi:MAG TPA: hypothetical protein VK797_05070 [Tepidisphaeraceae bacterium]|jgi:hypothetical protein|nr:hypothetical protein [Tepidisphaeraceae bacterium]